MPKLDVPFEILKDVTGCVDVTVGRIGIVLCKDVGNCGNIRTCLCS